MNVSSRNRFGFHAWTAIFVIAAASCFLAAQRALEGTIFSLGKWEALMYAIVFWFALWRKGRFRQMAGA